MDTIARGGRRAGAVLEGEAHLQAAGEELVAEGKPAWPGEAVADGIALLPFQGGEQFALALGDGEGLIAHQAVDVVLDPALLLMDSPALEGIARVAQPAGAGEHVEAAGHVRRVAEEGGAVEVDELAAVHLERHQVRAHAGRHRDANGVALGAGLERLGVQVGLGELAHGGHPCRGT